MTVAASWLLVVPALVLSSARAGAPPEKVQLTMATLHAAVLTTSRAAGDSTDSPFLMIAINGPRGGSTTMVPDGPKSIRQDEAIGARPLTELNLASGDSVQLLVSVLENAGAQVSGAHWLGSASLLITNEEGAIFWRRLECVASCRVLNAPASTALPATAAQPLAGVVELSGSGGTYHLALRAARTQ